MALEMFRCLLSNETRITSKLFCNFSYVQNSCKRSSFFFFFLSISPLTELYMSSDFFISFILVLGSSNLHF